MEGTEFEKLKEEMADLRKEVAAMKRLQSEDIRRVARALRIFKQNITDLKKIQDKDFEELQRVIKSVYTTAYQHVANIYDMVWPIEDKIFPGARMTRKRLKEIMGPKNLFANDRWDKKDKKAH